MLRSGGEHSIRLEAASRHQVIDEDTDVALVAPDHKRRLTTGRARCVDAGNEALSCRFLVSGCAIDLTREEQSSHTVSFECRLQFRRLNEVVLDRITRPQDNRVLQDQATHERALPEHRAATTSRSH